MGYIEKSLAGNEHLIYRARFPWFYRATAWLGLIAAALVAIALYERSAPVFAACAAAAGALLFLTVMVPIWSREIAVTTQRLIYRRGLVGRSTEELQLGAVEEVQVEQSVLGRLLGYGYVSLSGTGVEDVRLPALGDPVRLRQMIQEAISMDGVVWQPGVRATA